jgi:hypothetical protein
MGWAREKNRNRHTVGGTSATAAVAIAMRARPGTLAGRLFTDLTSFFHFSSPG